MMGYQVLKNQIVFLHGMTCLVLLVNGRSSMRIGSTLLDTATLVSPGGVFEVGFVSGQKRNVSASLMFTLAIWYALPGSTYNVTVWVADRSIALNTTDNASFSLSPLGDLQVHDTCGTLVWHSNTEHMNVVNVSMEDTGNLVLVNTSNEVVWQSFDSPTDTLLPNQVFDTKMELIAWEYERDWSPGAHSLTWTASLNGLAASWQIPYPWQDPSITYWTSVRAFSHVVLSSDGVFRGYNSSVNATTISIGNAAVAGVHNRLSLDYDGNLRIYSWSVGSNWTVEWFALPTDVNSTLGNCEIPAKWSVAGLSCSCVGSTPILVLVAKLVALPPTDSSFTLTLRARVPLSLLEVLACVHNMWFYAQTLGYCGPYSICDRSQCTCPPQFVFVDVADKSLGCRRLEPAAYCTPNAPADTFTIESNVNWNLNNLATVGNVTLDECLQLCLASCDCQAVASRIPDNPTDILSECYHKRDFLLSGRIWYNSRTYLRVRASPISDKHDLNHGVVYILSAAVVIVAVMLCTSGVFFVLWKRKKARQKKLHVHWMVAKGAMVRFTYGEIMHMTESFKDKIGEGGYGTVFRGQIEVDGESERTVKVVAVKQLHKELSTRIEKEFLNEVETLGLIHHVHLVSLIGYCSDAKHRLLVYEYVERGSLDKILFRDRESNVLEWRIRMAIAIQTARGLAYLHEDCRQWIIHCDVKPENILLDADYNAKVADFGLSRIKGRDRMTVTQTRTMSIRGTLGYLAPEYWMPDRIISNKVDVFSYGMVLLEIISGRRNFVSEEPQVYFPLWAFPKLETEAFMDVVDPVVVVDADPREVERVLQVAFWCINEKPQARPSMSDVVQMLQGNMAIKVPVPRPGLFDMVELGDNGEDDHSGTSHSSRLYSTTSSRP